MQFHGGQYILCNVQDFVTILVIGKAPEQASYFSGVFRVTLEVAPLYTRCATLCIIKQWEVDAYFICLDYASRAFISIKSMLKQPQRGATNTR
jgi:hypothetical protein